MPSSGGAESSQVADANAASDNRVTDIDIDGGGPSWSVAEHKTRYEDTLDAWRFGAMFSDGANSIICGRQNVRRDTDIGAWNRRGALLW